MTAKLITGLLSLCFALSVQAQFLQHRRSAFRPVAEGVSFPSTNNLVAYWRLDEQSGARIDSWGANDLTDDSSVSYAVSFKTYFTNAVDCESSSSDSLSISDNAALSMANEQSFTIAFWAQPESIAGGSVVCKRVNSDATTEYSVYLNDGAGETDYWRFLLGNGSVNTFVDADDFGDITPNGSTWYCVIAWYDATANTVHIRVDATTDSTAQSYTQGSYDSAGDLNIGRKVGSLYFDGRIDEVAIWKRVLSSDERDAFYSGGNGVAFPYNQ